MKKIIIIGCPGSGKSTMVLKMNEKLHYPVLHLDKIYHIDNENHISRDELIQKVTKFNDDNDCWIIDGNYLSTMEGRINIADTIILLDIDSDICISNVIKRTKEGKRLDMADGFDNSQIKDEFLNFIQNFKQESLPKILTMLNHYRNNKEIIIIKDYNEMNRFIENL